MSLDPYVSLSASKVVNKIGRFQLSLPTSFDLSVLRRDLVVQVWLTTSGGYPLLWNSYFVRRWKPMWEQGRESIMVWGPDAKDILRRRHVIAYEGTADALFTDYADDVMRELVRDAKSDGIDPPDAGTRVLPDLTVGSDRSVGPIVSCEVAWMPLLTLSGSGALPLLAKLAAEEGTPVFFDVVPDTIGSDAVSYRFETEVVQPMLDVSDRVVFSGDQGTLSGPYWEFDATNEANYVYVGGAGEGVERIVQQVYDAPRYGESAWNRCELFVDASSEEDINVLDGMGQDALQVGKPLERLGGIPLDAPGLGFGAHWDVGYRVGAKYRTVERTPYVSAATVRAVAQGTSVQAVLTYN